MQGLFEYIQIGGTTGKHIPHYCAHSSVKSIGLGLFLRRHPQQPHSSESQPLYQLGDHKIDSSKGVVLGYTMANWHEISLKLVRRNPLENSR
jgi:hypothetical protein